MLGLVTLYHFTTGEPREFYPVDADVQLKAGTYLRQPSGVSLQQAAPVTQGKPRRGRPPKEQPGATQAQVASSQASPVALQQQEPNGD